MKIEIVEFHIASTRSDKNNQTIGRFHVYLCDLDVDLKGVAIRKKKGQHKIWFPNSFGVCQETGKSIGYTVFQFCNQKKNEELKQSILDECEEFLIEWFKDNPGWKEYAEKWGY